MAMKQIFEGGEKRTHYQLYNISALSDCFCRNFGNGFIFVDQDLFTKLKHQGDVKFKHCMLFYLEQISKTANLTTCKIVIGE